MNRRSFLQLMAAAAALPLVGKELISIFAPSNEVRKISLPTKGAGETLRFGVDHALHKCESVLLMSDGVNWHIVG